MVAVNRRSEAMRCSNSRARGTARSRDAPASSTWQSADTSRLTE